MKRLGILLACSLLLAGCVKHVALNITNPTPVDLNVSIQKQDSNKFSQGDVNVGTVAKSGGKATQKFDVPRNGGYEVTASLPGSAQVFDQAFSVAGESNPVDKDLNLSLGANLVPSDGDKLKALFGKLGDDKGFAPQELGNALKTIVGSLIVYAPPVPPNTEQDIRYQLSPGKFSSVMDLNGFPYIPTDDSTDDQVKNDTTVDITGSIPIYGSLSANFSNGSLYKVHTELKGYGWADKTEPADFSLEDKIEKLDSTEKKAICAAMQDKKATLTYVNRVYAIELANFTYEEGHNISASTKLTGASVISGSVAYDFSNAQARSFSFQQVALNFSGINKTYDQLPCKAWTTLVVSGNPIAGGSSGAAGSPVGGGGHIGAAVAGVPPSPPPPPPHVDPQSTKAVLPPGLIRSLKPTPAKAETK